VKGQGAVRTSHTGVLLADGSVEVKL
jgi:hypothetical protein